MSKRKLLLADDSVTIQKVVNLTFADEGIEVISVGDGDSAMEKVAEVSPDLIMADVNMPGLTGYEICERIRQDDNLRQTPVILLVGSFEPFDEDEARRVGADDYLTKPFQSIRQLVNKVTVLLDARNGDNGVQVNNASSLEDTLEMDVPGLTESVSTTSKYEDTGFDDEMIQTNQPASFALDETRKFEARETGELSSPLQFERYSISEKTFEESFDSENKTEFIDDEVVDTETIKSRSEGSYDFNDKVIDSNEIREEDDQAQAKSNEFSNEIIDNEDNSYEIIGEESQTAGFNEDTKSISEYSATAHHSETENDSKIFYEKNEDSNLEIQENDVVSDAINESDDRLERISDSEDFSEVADVNETTFDVEAKIESFDNSENVQNSDETEGIIENSTELITEEFVEETFQAKTLERVEEQSDETEIKDSYTEFLADSNDIKETESPDDISDEEPDSLNGDSDVVKDYELVSDDSQDSLVHDVSDESEINTQFSETTEISELKEFEEESETLVTAQKTSEEEIPLPEFASVLELDDDDILQLPPFENEIEFEENVESTKESKVYYAANSLGLAVPSENKSAIEIAQISDDLIELIVAKVLERLSEKAIKEVAWEVVPQMTEVIVKKMAEEKLKD